MTAKESSFCQIVQGDRYYDIPFFQRGYVWDKENWEELISDLTDGKSGHFFGSVILKPILNPLTGFGVWSIIDGQQRLTTLSVLLKVCYDILVETATTDDEKAYYESPINQLLFNREKKGRCTKIRHSRVDRPAYEEVMLGKTSAHKPSSAIIDCYNFFLSLLKLDIDKATQIFEELKGDMKLFVGITLDKEENEQSIFDTINSAGVRLTSADTIKNSVFQRLMDLSNSEDEKEDVISLYRDKWEAVFSLDEDAVAYWNKERRQGRINRTVIEIFLQSVAIIKGIYDPYTHAVDELAQCYKSYISTKTRSEVESFVEEIFNYANIYRKFFEEFGDGTHFKFENDCQRVLHILQFCDTSTFDPLLLKFVSDNPPDDNGCINEQLKNNLHSLECYVLRHIASGASTKNFNKDCANIFTSKRTIHDYLQEKITEGEIDDIHVRTGLFHVKTNKIAAGILFWMELHRRSLPGKYFDINELKFDFTLEHIMPKQWAAHWGANVLPVVDVQTGQMVTDVSKAKEIRNTAIFELGNMALLNDSLNTSIRNLSLKNKIDGTAKKHGIGKLAELTCTREVIDYAKNHNYIWNEISIRERSERLADEFLKIWS